MISRFVETLSASAFDNFILGTRLSLNRLVALRLCSCSELSTMLPGQRRLPASSDGFDGHTS